MENQPIILNSFVERTYQTPILDAIEKGFRKLICVLPRRSGKDVVAFNIAIQQCLKERCLVWYCLPFYSQARKVIFDNIMIDNRRLADFIPKQLLLKTNSSEMKYVFINGSILQLVGSDSYQKLVGANPKLIIMSEYSRANPESYKYFRPMLAANGGTVLFISTPYGKNSFYDMWLIAKDHPEDWFTYLLTVDDTKHISKQEMDKEVADGILAPDELLQEYYCSFLAGQEGTFYGKYIEQMRFDGKITSVVYDPFLLVNTAWDLGIDNAMCVIFFQVTKSGTIKIIDYHTESGKGLDYFAQVLKNKCYSYGVHIAPHDLKQRELSTAMSRMSIAADLGINFTLAPNLSVEDGINAVKMLLSSKVWIDENRCAKLIKAVESYRREWDATKQRYKPNPLHDWSSDASDCLRYLAISINKLDIGRSAEDIDKLYQEVAYGDVTNIHPALRDNENVHWR
jgi:phage terminase large subunit